MSYTITCPLCGKRDSYEFRFGGEVRGPRPAEDGLDAKTFSDWYHRHDNKPGPQKEWWYHRDGCGSWFTTWRDTLTNREIEAPEGQE